MSKSEKTSSIILKVIAIIIVISWMVIVFIFSGQNGYKSLNLSGKVINKIEQIVTQKETKAENSTVTQEESSKKENTKKENENNKYIYAYSNKTQLIVRKTAHFILYMIGGFALSVFFYSFTERGFKSSKHFIKGYMILASLFGVGYAISDEIHQKYVLGRTSSIRDMVIDSSGIIVGVLLTTIVINIILKIKKKK